MSTTKEKETKKKPSLKYLRDKDREKVKGIFQFHECPGGTLSFCFKIYQEDPLEFYTLKDGTQYEIPLGVARHLNQNGWYPVHHYEKNESGNPTVEIGQKRHRYSFRSLDFMASEDLQEPVDIVSVRQVI
jgi:hypothetical protein